MIWNPASIRATSIFRILRANLLEEKNKIGHILHTTHFYQLAPQILKTQAILEYLTFLWTPTNLHTTA